MMFNEATFVGVDPTAGENPFGYAALDNDLKLLALGEGTIDDVLAFSAGQSKALVAVCSPRRPNIGLIADQGIRAALSPPPSPGRWMNYRIVEFYLRQHGIMVPRTPAIEKECPNWMRMGFIFYQRLEDFGYQAYPQREVERQFIEVYPHASYTALLGVVPFTKRNLEGRLQRQLILFERGINLPDPMRFFEEITRHKLINGILPLENLYSYSELDSLVAAYTAWLVGNHPEKSSSLGDVHEGQIFLPVPHLNEHY